MPVPHLWQLSKFRSRKKFTPPKLLGAHLTRPHNASIPFGTTEHGVVPGQGSARRDTGRVVGTGADEEQGPDGKGSRLGPVRVGGTYIRTRAEGRGRSGPEILGLVGGSFHERCSGPGSSGPRRRTSRCAHCSGSRAGSPLTYTNGRCVHGRGG